MLMDSWYPEAYAMYTPAVATPPAGVVDDWVLLWELARRLGTTISLLGGPLDMSRRPTTDEILENVSHYARVPISEVRKHASGALFPSDEVVRVKAGDPEAKGRLAVAPESLVDELREVLAEPVVEGAGYRIGEVFSHRLIGRRLREVCNSVGQDLPSLRAKRRHNPAFMNPEDLIELGLSTGDLIEIESGHGLIVGVAEAAEDVLTGVISMTHSWGNLPELDASPRDHGSCTAMLIDTANDFDPISGIPRMSAIPVNVRAAN
jgi:anaerobic selenocysteine-containing dehydrogenase